MQERQEPKHLSYSSLSSYAECGERWRLSRVYHLDRSTWWVTLGGTAAHSLSEKWDLGEMSDEEVADEFPRELDRAIADYHERFGDDAEIKASGRQTQSMTNAGGPNKKDREWVEHFFPKYLQTYFDWRRESGWELLEIEGFGPGIEVPIMTDMGGEPIKGAIDRVFVVPTRNPLAGAVLGGADESLPEVAVVDLKFGRKPESTLQLKSYFVGLERQYGVRADFGSYFVASSSGLQPGVEFESMPDGYVDALFEQAWRGIRAGVFLPNVSSFCGTCPVRSYCGAVGGEKAGEVPLLEADLTMPEHLR